MAYSSTRRLGWCLCVITILTVTARFCLLHYTLSAQTSLINTHKTPAIKLLTISILLRVMSLGLYCTQ